MNVLSFTQGLSSDSHSTRRNVFTLYRDNQESVHRPERWLPGVWENHYLQLWSCRFPSWANRILHLEQQADEFLPSLLHSIPPSSLEDTGLTFEPQALVSASPSCCFWCGLRSLGITPLSQQRQEGNECVLRTELSLLQRDREGRAKSVSCKWKLLTGWEDCLYRYQEQPGRGASPPALRWSLGSSPFTPKPSLTPSPVLSESFLLAILGFTVGKVLCPRKQTGLDGWHPPIKGKWALSSLRVSSPCWMVCTYYWFLLGSSPSSHSDVLDEGGAWRFTAYRINLHLFSSWEKQGFYYRLEAP